MNVGHIIVQAGGKGTRMEFLTNNKPKALVPIDNLPMLFHLFRKYPKAKYTVIGDYKFDVLEKYLAAFAEVEYSIVCATGSTGTCAGLRNALAEIPSDESFMLIWSDLVLPEIFRLPETKTNYIGISKDFICRWKYENNFFSEEKSDEHGVAGLFIFENKDILKEVPESGELVRWMSAQGFNFEELPLYRTKEYGLISEYNKHPKMKCRPFNTIIEEDGIIIKEAIDAQGETLAIRERAWYEKVMDAGFVNIPRIHTLNPLKMERIKGKNVYEYNDLQFSQKKEILSQLIGCLKNVQMLETVPSNYDSYMEAYIGKTISRLTKVKDLVPFAKDKVIVINGKTCPNIFFHWESVERSIKEYFPQEFKLIHGDCTFSNTMLREDEIPVLIDPRGYFGDTEFFGDPAYDWAKLYYSLVGNYDQFNLKRFRLDIREKDVLLEIESNHWEDMEQTFFEMLKEDVSVEQIKLLHSIIWLSLTTYAWEDYDSICGAFYNGLYYLEEII